MIFLSLVLEGNGRREEKDRNDFYFYLRCVSARRCAVFKVSVHEKTRGRNTKEGEGRCVWMRVPWEGTHTLQDVLNTCRYRDSGNTLIG